MKRLLLSTAILGAATVPALAQDQSVFREAPDAMEIRASDFMGMRVYASETAVEGEELEGIQEGWEDIGEINDIVMDRDGMVQAVLVDIGGFLGIGERTVAVSMDALQFVSDSATAEQVNDFFLVMNANREAIEAAPEYMDQQGSEMSAQQAATETEQAIEEGGESVAAAGAAASAAAGAAVGSAVEGAENAVEETGEEIADAGSEVADAGEEVSEEVAQTGMTDTQEDQAEVADAQTDAVEEASEETAQASAEASDEATDQTEMAAEGSMTEAEMATEQTADAATAEEGELTTADTQEEVVVSNVPAEGEAAATETDTMASTETETEGEVANTELTSAETTGRTPIVREGFVAAGAEDMTADRLQGAAVYDANDERVGEVGEIVLSTDGQVQMLVIDVGGFLGIGEKPVALELASIDILRQDGGEEIRVYVSQTEEELEGMERYEAQ